MLCQLIHYDLTKNIDEFVICLQDNSKDMKISEIFRPIFCLYQNYVLQYCDPLDEVDWTLLAFLKNIIQNVPIPQDATI